MHVIILRGEALSVRCFSYGRSQWSYTSLDAFNATIITDKLFAFISSSFSVHF